ncbi:MAG TPA: hypothetical protein VGR25_01210 [bacterium]|nr:hypothetical protein [bacterium]
MSRPFITSSTLEILAFGADAFSMTDQDQVVAPILAEIQAVTPEEAEAYLCGAARDGTFNRLHSTTRISQADVRWLHILRAVLQRCGKGGWIYRESRRSVWTIETTWQPYSIVENRSSAEQIAFARGYFDAEGGIPTEHSSRFYIQLVQKI